MHRKKLILIVSLILLTLISCGKKGNPLPKGLPVPAGISDLRGDVKDSLLFISFTIPTRNQDGTEVRDLEGFRILKGCGGCAGGLERWKDIRLTDKEGYTIRDGRLYTYDNDLKEGFDYGYRVFAFTTKGIQGEGSNTFSITWQKTPPPPKNVTAKAGDARVTLTCEKEQDAFYNVYRIEEGIYPLFALNTSPLGTCELTDMGLQNGREYRYEVRAVRIYNGIPFEGEGTIIAAVPKDMTPPAPPKDLKLEKKGAGVYLSWAPNTESDVAGYNIYRLRGGKAEKINKDVVKRPSFQDDGTGKERYLSYYVTAVDLPGNESPPSREEIIILKE